MNQPFKFCKLGQCQCRHCSDETYRETQRTPDFKQHKMTITEKVIPLGQYCNNACCWTNDLKECPIPAALEVCRKAIATPPEDNPLEWMKRKGVC